MINPIFKETSAKIFNNPKAANRGEWPDALDQRISRQSLLKAQKSIVQWPNYQPTPLHSLKEIASNCGLNNIYYKDEDPRFGLRSFKALGGAYAVSQLLIRKLSDSTNQVRIEDLLSGKYREQTQEIVLVTATDGNHGRSVAWGAEMFGCPCYIYMHQGVSKGRAAAVEAFGAKVVRVKGDYDDSVAEALEDAEKNNWHVVSDTSWEGYTQIPTDVMSGYSILMKESFDQIPTDQLPTHVFVQAGVGGLAAMVVSYLWQKFGVATPRIIVVEPSLAPCLYYSAVEGWAKTFKIEEETIMAGLSCGEPTLVGWPILIEGVDDFLVIEDEVIAPTMQLLVEEGAENFVIGGESGVVGLAAAILSSQQEELTRQLGLDSSSNVFVIGTEGITDPDIYKELVGFIPLDHS